MLYNDRSYHFIHEEYDDYVVERPRIASVVHDNPSSSIMYGNYETNEYQVVIPLTSSRPAS